MKETLTRLRLILETINDGILVVNTQGAVLYANHAAEHLLERETLAGKRLAIPIDAGLSGHQDINLIRRSGIAWAEMRSTPLTWEGKSAYLLCLRDITARKQAEMALQQSEALFHTLAKVAPVGIFKTDPQGHFEYVNERWCEISGLSADQALGDGWHIAIDSEDRQPVLLEWRRCLQNQAVFSYQYRMQHSNGYIHWVISRAEAEADSGGSVLGYVGTITDITDIKKNEEYLEQAAAVFETIHEGVIITDIDRRILMVNRAFSQITGFSESEAIGNTPSLLSSGRHSDEFYSEMWAEIVGKDHWQGEIWNRRKDGEIYPELLSVNTIRNQLGEITNYVGVFADISKLKASEQDLEFLAHHDLLTLLPNRTLFLSRLQHCIQNAQRHDHQLAVLMLDLDRFKDVNDSFGHLAGDELLQKVASRLAQRLRISDTICRIGGDEFMVLLEEIAHPESAALVANEIITSLSEVWALTSGNEVRIGVSIGIALYPEHGANPNQLMQHADTALYEAKNEGRNCFKYFSESLTIAARDRIDIENRLRHALVKNELQVFYQPQIDINSGRVIGAEALLRWQTASGEMIPPQRFIPVAEETGLITSIGDWVLMETCRQGRQWLDAGLPPLRLSVNLSPQQFLYSDIREVVARTLQETGFPAGLLELELTESTLMKREKEAIEILHRLHALGVHLSIDDFGTGYSSLSYLKLFPMDVLKIDKSFIEDIPEHGDDMEITATIIAMAKTLRMRVIAEGVETQDQLDFLRIHRCDLYQGFFASRSLPADEFLGFLAGYKAV